MIMTFITLKYMMLLLKMVGYGKFNACRVSAVLSKYLHFKAKRNPKLRPRSSTIPRRNREWRKGE